MPWRCSVPGCGKRNQEKVKGVVIHRFPEKDLELCSKWLAAIDRDGTKTERKYASLRVCSQHFSPDDYQRDLKAELLGCPPKKVLKKTAIPTIFQTKRKPGRRPSQTLNKTQPQQQSYPDHAERFDSYLQVLCTESVCGRCYWEVEWSGNKGVSLAVSYKDISRKGNGIEYKFGFNDQSWRLFCSPNEFIFGQNNRQFSVPVMPSSSRIGVYVDHRAGILSFVVDKKCHKINIREVQIQIQVRANTFYGVSDTMKLLHRVHTTFTQPLYPGFMVCKGSRVKLCHLK
ncbi:cytolytic toxin-beta-like [Ictalurus punctatus]|uniref:Cytolytic toxin-beta-like n=1 Tax=Ictalurus punctatus TaxID=7998 RepID=A0A9F7R7T2_ICTPU|nr:cytolytic toxin-beta-like [Ictalurus punctatus]